MRRNKYNPLLLQTFILFLSGNVYVCLANPESKPKFHFHSSTESHNENDIYNSNHVTGKEYTKSSSNLIDSIRIKSAYVNGMEDQCPLSLKLTSVQNRIGRGGGIIGTPTLFPFVSHKAGSQAVLTSFSDYLELLSFEKGLEAEEDVDLMAFADFPLLFEGSTFYGSPIVQDVDGDGVEDVVMVDFDGRGIVVKLNGKMHDQSKNKIHWGFQVPRLFIRKGWYNETISESNENNEQLYRQRYTEPFHSYFEWEGEWAEKRNEELEKKGSSAKSRRLSVVEDPVPKLFEEGTGKTPELEQNIEGKAPGKSEITSENLSTIDLDQEISLETNGLPDFEKSEPLVYGGDDKDSSEANRNRNIIEEHLQRHKEEIENDPVFSDLLAKSEDAYEEPNIIDDVWTLKQTDDGVGLVDLESESGMNDDGMHHGWDGPTYDDMQVHLHDDYYAYHHDDGYFNEEKYIALDPHVLSSPHIAYIDAEPFLFVSVSYFYEEDQYQHDSDERLPIPLDEMKNYASSAVLRYSFNSKRWVHEEHLDLSSNPNFKVEQRAFSYATPTVVDIDGDSKKEVIVGTSFGMLYVMNTYGSHRDGFPIKMGEIIAQVSVADVIGSPDLELFAADVEGNIICLNTRGETIWHQNVGGAVTKAPKLGDLNGDGVLEVIITSTNPNSNGSWIVWAFDAATGSIFENFPLSISEPNRFQSSLQPEILLVDLHESQQHWLHKDIDERGRPKSVPHGGYGKGLHIVIPADKYLYFIEGSTGCTNRINIGESVRSMVLAGDISVNGNLSLLTSTINGELLTFETPLVAHSLNTWTSPLRSRLNGFVQGYSSPIGIVVNEKSSEFRDILGVMFPVTFEIFDRRNLPDDYKRKYLVCIGIGTSQKQLRFAKEYNTTGVFTERITLPEGGKHYTIVVSLTSEHSLYFEETFTVGYNVNFSYGLEWLVALPMIVAAIPLILYRRNMTIDDGSLLGTTVNDSRWRSRVD